MYNPKSDGALIPWRARLNEFSRTEQKTEHDKYLKFWFYITTKDRVGMHVRIVSSVGDVQGGGANRSE